MPALRLGVLEPRHLDAQRVRAAAEALDRVDPHDAFILPREEIDVSDEHPPSAKMRAMRCRRYGSRSTEQSRPSEADVARAVGTCECTAGPPLRRASRSDRSLSQPAQADGRSDSSKRGVVLVGGAWLSARDEGGRLGRAPATAEEEQRRREQHQPNEGSRASDRASGVLGRVIPGVTGACRSGSRGQSGRSSTHWKTG